MDRSIALLLGRGAATALLAVVLAACAGAAPTRSPGAGLPGTGLTGADVPTGVVPGSSGSGGTIGSSGGNPGHVDYCAVFTAAEITAFLGRTAHLGGTQAASTPDNCTWQDADLTTLWLLKSDADACASDRDTIGSAGAAYPGADFAGPSPLGAMFAGVVASGACYEVEVTPTERSPKADALAQLLQQFVQRVGA